LRHTESNAGEEEMGMTLKSTINEKTPIAVNTNIVDRGQSSHNGSIESLNQDEHMKKSRQEMEKQKAPKVVVQTESYQQ